MKMPLIALPLALLCACSQSPSSTAVPATTSSAGKTAAVADSDVHVDTRNGFAIAVPADMSLRHDFQRSYLGGAEWKAFAGPASQGTPVLALVLNGSNKITAAELRIGISADTDALAHCAAVPASGEASTSDQVALAGVPFTHFRAGDAAMSHYLNVESYRAVHAGRCYAIDLLLTGTRPEVYDPPATPPFAQADAKQRLHDALDGFRFVPAIPAGN